MASASAARPAYRMSVLSRWIGPLRTPRQGSSCSARTFSRCFHGGPGNRQVIPPSGSPGLPGNTCAQGRERYAVLIDGDVASHTHWPAILDAVRCRGEVANCLAFGWHTFGQGERQQRTLTECGIEVVRVPRRGHGGKDPNDIAIGMHASRFVSSGQATAIALVAQDADFVYLAECLRSWGHKTLALLPSGAKAGLRLAFENAGADVEVYTPATGSPGRPKFKAILRADGESEFQASDVDLHGVAVDDVIVKDLLYSLGYLQDPSEPLMAAIAKFYHVNNLGPLTVYPDIIGRFEALDRIKLHKHHSWLRNPADLAFIVPHCGSTKTKSILRKYGSARCRSIVVGGGPFILRDRGRLVQECLRRLGYWDTGLNNDLWEAVEVFCAAGGNASSLKALGLGDQVWTLLRDSAKHEFLHSVLLSTRSHGYWHVSPKDLQVRKLLANEQKIAGVDAPVGAVFDALRAYAGIHGIASRKTYNGLVMEVNKHVYANDPGRRR